MLVEGGGKGFVFTVPIGTGVFFRARWKPIFFRFIHIKYLYIQTEEDRKKLSMFQKRKNPYANCLWTIAMVFSF